MLCPLCFFFFFNHPATTEIYTLSLHDALPIWSNLSQGPDADDHAVRSAAVPGFPMGAALGGRARTILRSEEHTSELQSQFHLVCRLLLEKKKKNRQSAGCLGTHMRPAHLARCP